MPLKLVLTGLEFSLDSTRLRIGRAEHLDVSIHGDPLISSNHCIIDGGVLVDAASTNGTSVNGQKIKHDTKVTLKHGDIVTLGETSLYVVEGTPYDGVVPTTADGKPIEISTKGGTGKQAKKKETAGGNKASSARVKQRAGHEREGSSSALSAASSALPSPASSTSTMYRPAPTAPASPTNQYPIASSAPPSGQHSTFTFIDQSRPLPAASTLGNTGTHHSSRSSSFASRTADTDRSRLLDISSQASLDDSLNGEGLIDLSAPHGRPHGGEGQAGDVDDSAMELDEDSINISMDSAAARALDSMHRINALHGGDTASHPSAPPPPYQHLPSPSPTSASASSVLSPSSHSHDLNMTRLADDGGNGSIGGDSPKSAQVRQLKDALRESEVRAGRLERKLSHTQRRVSGAQADANNRQAARVGELEGQVASLSYQLLYGAGPKDQEIQRLSDELKKARAESEKHKEAAEVQRNVAVKEERLSAQETAARVEKEKQALTAITDASTLLSTTRADLISAVAEYSTQMNSLLSLQQTLATQQQVLVKSIKAAPQKQEGAADKKDEAYQQLVSAVNEAAHSTAAALAAEKKAKEQREAEWKREFAAITSQVTEVNQLVTQLHDKATSVKEEQTETEGDKAETAALRPRVGRGDVEESKRREGETDISAASPGKASLSTPVTAASVGMPPVALQSDVVGLKSQVSSMSSQLQQVWIMVAVLLALSAVILVVRR